MDINSEASVASDVGQYARSIRSKPDTGPNVTFSEVGSIGKTPAVGSQGSASSALQGAAAAAAAAGDGSHDAPSVVFSDVDSLGKPPNITSRKQRRH